LPFELDKETIERVARLSRIELTPEEKERFLADLKEVLDAFSMLDEAKSDCDPAFHPIEITNHLREDEAAIRIDPDEIISGMNILQRYIRGPRMQ
jgi:aspartyl-tRNA(Asn)/glutamyl-tRNA(Gln) amidotransferase subunit C